MDENPFWTALKLAAMFAGLVLGFIVVVILLDLVLPNWVALMIGFFLLVFVVYYIELKNP
jgi:uncharacterized membrane protein YccC